MVARSSETVNAANARFEELSADKKLRQLALERELARATLVIERKLGVDEGKRLGLDEGKRLGVDEGKKLGLEKAIEALCRAFEIDLDPARRAELAGKSVAELSALLDALSAHRQWPTG